jgi:dimethylhistidine N-methyltransferase
MPDGVTLRPAARGIAAEALAGLTSARKTLPAKLFYDDEGCRLFGEITQLPEYYLTRTERALLEGRSPEIAAMLPEGATLVEYGASMEDKAALLLRALEDAGRPARAYVPIDVAQPALDALKARMAISHPSLRVMPVAGDFLGVLNLPRLRLPIGFFPGSTIGNLDPETARRFLIGVRNALGAGARFLVGVDLRKDPTVLIPAYDDAAGVTAAFNRNLLARLNREAGADFALDGFQHQARWNEAEGRIEMHLVSAHAQSVQVAGVEIRFAAGESIHTENSYKHTADSFRNLARQAGWEASHLWTDDGRLFSLHLLTAPGHTEVEP